VADIDIQFSRDVKREDSEVPEGTFQSLFGNAIFPSFIVDSAMKSKRAARARPPLPRELVRLPVPGKKSWHVPVPPKFEMKAFLGYTCSHWEEPPIEIQEKPPARRAVDFWDADDAEDFVDVTEADLQHK